MKTLALILLFVCASFAQSITAPSFIARTMDKVDVSITADGLSDIIACQWVLYYDDAVINATGSQSNNWGCDSGLLIGSASVFCNGSEAGTFRVAIVNPYGFAGSGTLLTIPFTTVKGDTDLDLEDVYLFNNGGAIKVDVGDGGITLQ